MMSRTRWLAAIAVTVVLPLVGASATAAGARTPPGRSASVAVAVDETFAVTCRRPWGEPAGTAVVRITATVPGDLATGETFSVPDLAYSASVTGQPLIRPDGTDQSFVTPTTTMTVVAPAGETVTLRLESFIVILAERPVASCFPDGDGVLARIPVVASGTAQPEAL